MIMKEFFDIESNVSGGFRFLSGVFLGDILRYYKVSGGFRFFMWVCY